MGKRRNSNPQGCGAEETRSVFQRSTQGAKRRSGARPPTRRTRNPSVPHQPRAPHVKQIEPTPPSGGIRTRKGAELRKREAFSSAARKERSDAAGRGRRPGGRGIPPSHTSQEPLTSSKSSQRRQAEGFEPARVRSDAAGRGRRRQTRCRHLGTLLSAGIIGTSPSAGSGLFSRTLRRTVAKKRQI